MACQSAPPSLGETSLSIVNGTESIADDAVVALVYRDKQFCTGTLVGKRTVVTAAHCLPPNSNVPLFGIEVVFGNKVGPESIRLSVVDGLASPEWDEDKVGGDIGLLALSDDAPVEPMPMAYYNVTALPEMLPQLRAVGFGVTEADGEGNGTKRTGMLAVEHYDETSIYLNPGPASTCNGDSGGALIFVRDGREFLGGIHSRSDCSSAIIAERVDIHTMNMITPFMEAHEGNASCAKDGMCGSECAEPDPDCPCVEDGVCSDFCAYLESDLDCTAECIGDDCIVEDSKVCSDDSCMGSDQPGGCSTGGSQAPWSFALLLGALIWRRESRRNALCD